METNNTLLIDFVKSKYNVFDIKTSSAKLKCPNPGCQENANIYFDKKAITIQCSFCFHSEKKLLKEPKKEVAKVSTAILENTQKIIDRNKKIDSFFVEKLSFELSTSTTIIKQLWHDLLEPKFKRNERLMELTLDTLEKMQLERKFTKQQIDHQFKSYLSMIDTIVYRYYDYVLDQTFSLYNIVSIKQKSFFEVSFYRYYYRDGYYQQLTEKDITIAVNSIAENITPPDRREKLEQNRLTARKTFDNRLSITRDIDFEKHEAKPIVNFKNGLLCIGKSKDRFIKHSKKFYSRFQLPTNYRVFNKPLAEIAPNFQAAIKTWFETEETRREALKLLYYTIADASRSEQIIIFLRGVGGDGKGQFINLVKQLISQDQISAIRIESMTSENTHILASLYGKLLNISDESRDNGPPIDGGLLKSVSGQSTIEINPKYAQSFSYVPLALWYIISNHALNNAADTSDGFFRRIKGLMFRKLNPKEKIKDFYKNKLAPEIEEIVYFIIHVGGLYYKQEGLVQTDSDLAVIKETQEVNPLYSFWFEQVEDAKDQNDPGMLFILTFSGRKYIDLHQKYEDFQKYAKKFGYKTVNFGNFTKKSEQILARVFKEIYPETFKDCKKTRINLNEERTKKTIGIVVNWIDSIKKETPSETQPIDLESFKID